MQQASRPLAADALSHAYVALADQTQRAAAHWQRHGAEGSDLHFRQLRLTLQTVVRAARSEPAPRQAAIRATLISWASSAERVLTDPQWANQFDRLRADVGFAARAAAQPLNKTRDVADHSSRRSTTSSKQDGHQARGLATPQTQGVSHPAKNGTKKNSNARIAAPSLATLGHPRDGRTASSTKVPLTQAPFLDPDLVTRTLGYVDVLLRNGKIERRPFRASLIEDQEGHPPLLMGSSIACGSFGKIVPIAYRDAHGDIQIVSGKLVRKSPATVKPGKNEQSKFGGRKTKVSTDAEFEEETALQEKIGGAVSVLGSRSFDNKRLLLMTMMDSSLIDAAMMVEPEQRSALARASLGSLATHLREIHAAGYVHVDGKADNALVQCKSAAIANSDFGLSARIEGKKRFVPTISSVHSPEMYRGDRSISFQHDVYCLGVTGLVCLNGGWGTHSPFYFSKFQDGTIDSRSTQRNIEQLVALRQSVLSTAAPSKEIDQDKLNNALQANTTLARTLRVAFSRDAELTSYILLRLLDPNESDRPTSAQAASDLSRFAAVAEGRSQVFKSLYEKTARMRDAQDNLRRLAEAML